MARARFKPFNTRESINSVNSKIAKITFTSVVLFNIFRNTTHRLEEEQLEKIKINLSQIVIEIISVVFAVSLALIGNEFRENYNNEQLADVAIMNLRNEVKNNKTLLLKSIEAHEKTIAYLSEFLKTQKKDSTAQSYYFERLEETAWESMKISQVTQFIDFKLTSRISKVYTEQKIYNDLIIKMMDNMIFQGDYSDEKNIMKTLRRHLVNFYIILEIENNLLKTIEDFLTNNEK